MYAQTDKRFNGTSIPRTGCYFMTLIRMAETESSYDLDASDILAIYRRAMVEDMIDPDCYVSSPDGVLRITRQVIAALAPLHGGKRILQVGIDDKDGRRFWPWANGDRVDYYVGKFKTKWGYHFMLVNSEGQPIYNPDPRITGERVALVLYRRF